MSDVGLTADLGADAPPSLGPFEKIESAPAADEPAPAGPPPSKVLAFTVQDQGDTNWCWAAVAGSIADYYTQLEHDPPPPIQCEIAHQFTGVPCCPAKSNPNGNLTRPLALPLLQYGYLQGDAAIESAISFSNIQNDICSERPVCGRLNTAAGHFFVIIGYTHDDGQEHIVVADPAGVLNGPYLLSTFDAAAGAAWNETCRTKKKRDPQ